MLATSCYVIKSDRRRAGIDLWYHMNGTGQYVQTRESMKFGGIRVKTVTPLFSAK